MRIGIDLLWVRVGKCGGTESYIRTLLDGFGRYGRDNEYILLVSNDNGYSFEACDQYSNMKRQILPVESASQPKRILWENLHLDRAAKKLRIDIMFIPVYSMPQTYGSGIPYVCVIHDLQALHYPQYFSVARRLFLKNRWKHTCKVSAHIVVSSEYSKRDLESHYPVSAKKNSVIYVPVETKASKMSAEVLKEKYGIDSNAFFYCVSSMLPHKNLKTLLEAMAFRKRRGDITPLVISGVGGGRETFEEEVNKYGIQDMVIDTGYVSDEERDCLYENCCLFLFPSMFEGFGMPPIEAMQKGKNVVTTECACLREVTEGKAVYVKDPTNAKEWVDKIDETIRIPSQIWEFPNYNLKNITEQYLLVFERTKSMGGDR